MITGTIPTEIGNLNTLRILYLHNNRITGTVPTEIGNLENLGMLLYKSFTFY